jgi:hypothetical protein
MVAIIGLALAQVSGIAGPRMSVGAGALERSETEIGRFQSAAVCSRAESWNPEGPRVRTLTYRGLLGLRSQDTVQIRSVWISEGIVVADRSGR